MSSPTAATSLMDALLQVSRQYGRDPAFAIAGGGNTSAKTEERLSIKASGNALATITPEGFVEMHRPALDALLSATPAEEITLREQQFKEAVLAARIHPQKGQRPSVECVLHHLMPGALVVHTHPTPVNMLTCCRQGEIYVRKLFSNRVLWIPYVDPGWMLARTLDEQLRAWQLSTGKQNPLAVFMQNHGLIVSADTMEDIGRQTDEVISAINRLLGTIPAEEPFGPVTLLEPEPARELLRIMAPALRGLLAEGENLKVVTFDDSTPVQELVGGTNGRSAALAGPTIPDQIVYCQSFPLWFEPQIGESSANVLARLREALTQYKAERGSDPVIVLVQGLGLFAVGNDFSAANIARMVYLDTIKVMAGAIRLGGLRPMSAAEYGFIENWEAESYRRSITAGIAQRGRVMGKVAVVTGAAQGFGLEIAQSLAYEGAHVVLADVNAAGAQKAADHVNAGLNKRRAVGLPVNVTDGASVQDMLDAVLRTFGGLDLLISNAGVLRAGSVKTQPEKDFDLVTGVNYKGYFLCVQKTAPLLAIQRLVKPDYWSDIIQINSKSGLQGSNKNGAYAGSKFGGIGLTQSFALELVEDGIKVNAICPGNFFDGPLWSDPNNGLFVQYLRSGKVPGAKTIEDVRKFYEAKVPMGRGCAADDVMKAVYYLIEQKYETGQAVPVTGGQVMLS